MYSGSCLLNMMTNKMVSNRIVKWGDFRTEEMCDLLFSLSRCAAALWMVCNVSQANMFLNKNTTSFHAVLLNTCLCVGVKWCQTSIFRGLGSEVKYAEQLPRDIFVLIWCHSQWCYSSFLSVVLAGQSSNRHNSTKQSFPVVEIRDFMSKHSDGPGISWHPSNSCLHTSSLNHRGYFWFKLTATTCITQQCCAESSIATGRKINMQH